MPDCSQCEKPLGKFRRRCATCGACQNCCMCEEPTEKFDADELGLDPEDDDNA